MTRMIVYTCDWKATSQDGGEFMFSASRSVCCPLTSLGKLLQWEEQLDSHLLHGATQDSAGTGVEMLVSHQMLAAEAWALSLVGVWFFPRCHNVNLALSL